VVIAQIAAGSVSILLLLLTLTLAVTHNTQHRWKCHITDVDS